MYISEVSPTSRGRGDQRNCSGTHDSVHGAREYGPVLILDIYGRLLSRYTQPCTISYVGRIAGARIEVHRECTPVQLMDIEPEPCRSTKRSSQLLNSNFIVRLAQFTKVLGA